MSRILKDLRKRLDGINKTPNNYYIKLKDKIYKVTGQKPLEAKEIDDNSKIYEIDCKDEDFFFFFSINGRPEYVVYEGLRSSED